MLAQRRRQDASFGLCMHLLLVPLIEYPCFMEATMNAKREVDEQQHLHVLSELAQLTPLKVRSYHREIACQAPITIHPLKRSSHYRRWWTLLESRNSSMLLDHDAQTI